MTGSRTRVKVCGLTRAEDARAAVRAGADALGVILAPGHWRSVTLEQAEAIFAEVPRDVVRVGVFVDASLDDVEAAVRRLGLREVQLHGSEDPDFCRALPGAVVKTFRVGSGFDPGELEAYRGAVAAVLLDALVEGAAGGTGKAFDPALVRDLPDVAPVYVAGGLTPGGVGDVVRTMRPAGVDVSSGVEEGPGTKSAEKMEEFVAAVRAADDATKETEKR
jgi:phosphoribosylanthranilate isomerase